MKLGVHAKTNRSKPRNTEVIANRGPQSLRKSRLLTTAKTVRPEAPSLRWALGTGSLTSWWYCPVSEAASHGGGEQMKNIICRSIQVTPQHWVDRLGKRNRKALLGVMNFPWFLPQGLNISIPAEPSNQDCGRLHLNILIVSHRIRSTSKWGLFLLRSEI